jgi:23S rRNA A1618 N6-methylase RlmF
MTRTSGSASGEKPQRRRTALAIGIGAAAAWPLIDLMCVIARDFWVMMIAWYQP